MAQYEFECEKCGKVFTIQETFTEHDRHKHPECPGCASKQTRQLISSVHVQTSKKS